MAEFRALVEMSYAPEVAFRRDLGCSSFLAPLAVFGTTAAGLALARAPLEAAWAGAQLAARGATDDQIVAQMQAFGRMTTLAALATPIILLAKWLLLAVLFWAMFEAIARPIALGRILTVVAYAHLPTVVRDAVIVAILWLRTPEALAASTGLTVPLGVNLMVPSIPLPWSVLAGAVNPFEAWHAALLVLGLSLAGGLRWRPAAAVVSGVWLAVGLFQVALAALGLALRASF